ncbi:SnoaL-like domain-containing protein [Sphingomonas sp. AP4-R1]|uniref:nuclear transport factor 2 family protein n=1 Tax=Sphingomonas sp. AP4-R1 TaxID=2735134 RepID=UPI0014934D96|nr:nuclear transport factor 2 family protein [Sphingomonas sp. AP4-R1]QJU58245.1 SnoaL-like domain-containing protein [Sphingomonas sp. AP4-R1]
MKNEDTTTPSAVVNALYDGFERADATAIMELLADELDWRESDNFMLADRNPYRTPQAVADGVFGRLAGQFRDYEAAPTEIFPVGEVVIAIGRSKGVVAATGKTFDAQYAHVWRVREGKIVGFRQIIDTLEIFRAQQAG